MKKLLSIFVLLTLFVASISKVSARDNSEYNEVYERQMYEQRFAVTAGGLLMESFEKDINGSYIYPNSFCGAWITDNKLVVSVTSIDEDLLNEYKNVLSQYLNHVTFIKGDYSRNELQDLIVKIDKVVNDNYGERIQSFEIVETENRIKIGVSSSVLKKIANNNFLGYDVPVEFVLGQTTTPTTTNLTGGLKIHNNNRNLDITISACGTRYSSNVFVTCGHPTQVTGDIISYSGTNIGSVLYVHYDDYEYGDYEFVSITNTSYFSPTSYILSNPVIGYLSPVTNTIVRFYGAKTNSVGYGIITATGMQIYADSSIHIYGMTKVHVVSGNIQHGDSGGPFFLLSDSGVSYCGVLHGFSLTEDSELYGYFTPYQYLSTAGFSVNTTGGGN